MEGKGNEMAFQLKVQMWQYGLCNENVSGIAELAMNIVLHTGFEICLK